MLVLELREEVPPFKEVLAAVDVNLAVEHCTFRFSFRSQENLFFSL